MQHHGLRIKTRIIIPVSFLSLHLSVFFTREKNIVYKIFDAIVLMMAENFDFEIIGAKSILQHVIWE